MTLRQHLIDAGLLRPAPDDYRPAEFKNVGNRQILKIGDVYGYHAEYKPHTQRKPKRQRRKERREERAGRNV